MGLALHLSCSSSWPGSSGGSIFAHDVGKVGWRPSWMDHGSSHHHRCRQGRGQHFCDSQKRALHLCARRLPLGPSPLTPAFVPNPVMEPSTISLPPPARCFPLPKWIRRLLPMTSWGLPPERTIPPSTIQPPPRRWGTLALCFLCRPLRRQSRSQSMRQIIQWCTHQVGSDK